jgi:hypothetical protein
MAPFETALMRRAGSTRGRAAGEWIGCHVVLVYRKTPTPLDHYLRRLHPIGFVLRIVGCATSKLGLGIGQRLMLGGKYIFLLDHLTLTRFAPTSIEDDLGSGQTQPCVLGCAHYIDDGQETFLGAAPRQFAQVLERCATATGTVWTTGAFALTTTRVLAFGRAIFTWHLHLQCFAAGLGAADASTT